MSDDLIKRLLAEETDLTDCAADRIEELERENAEMAAAITDAENSGICSGGNLWRFWSRIAREAAHAKADERSAAEDKLAKAMEALRDAIQMLSQCLFTTIRIKGQYIDRQEFVDEANTVLAQLEGGE